MSISLFDKRNLLKGDIFTCDFGSVNGSVQSGVRPAVVVQENFLNKSSGTTIVAPITSVIKKASMRVHIPLGKNFGLKDESMILLEQIRVVNQSELFEYIGSIDDSSILNQIDDGIKNLFGIRTRRYVQNDIKKFCPKCLEKALLRNDSIIRLVDTFDRNSYTCEICGKDGNRYFVMKKDISKK